MLNKFEIQNMLLLFLITTGLMIAQSSDATFGGSAYIKTFGRWVTFGTLIVLLFYYIYWFIKNYYPERYNEPEYEKHYYWPRILYAVRKFLRIKYP